MGASAEHDKDEVFERFWRNVYEPESVKISQDMSRHRDSWFFLQRQRMQNIARFRNQASPWKG
jgi:hypothetical protein